jgi:hypothetical protein
VLLFHSGKRWMPQVILKEFAITTPIVGDIHSKV